MRFNRRGLIAAAMGGAVGRWLGIDGAQAAYGEDFIPAIHAAAARHGTSGAWLVEVMWCESAGDPHALNPMTGDAGLFQYQAQTFWRFAELSGIACSDHWNPWEQIELTAWAFGAGYCDHWVCGCWDGAPS